MSKVYTGFIINMFIPKNSFNLMRSSFFPLAIFFFCGLHIWSQANSETVVEIRTLYPGESGWPGRPGGSYPAHSDQPLLVKRAKDQKIIAPRNIGKNGPLGKGSKTIIAQLETGRTKPTGWKPVGLVQGSTLENPSTADGIKDYKLESIRKNNAKYRSLDERSAFLYVLAPEHIGYTILEKPTLYWYQSVPLKAKLEFTLIGKDKSKPIYTKCYSEAKGTGIKSVRLHDQSITLEKGVQYDWNVSVILDPEKSTKTLFASGIIERIDPPTRVLKSIVSRSKKDLVHVFSEEGIWYDAMDTVSKLIEANPDDLTLPELRAELLSQGNLSKVASTLAP